MADLIEIASADLSAAINPLGAELTHLRDAQGHELMTDADPRWWTGHAPILFPVVGRPNGDIIRLDGVDYAMKQHGFARHKMFKLVEQNAAHALFRLADTEETRAVYPFAFSLDVGFTLDGSTLKIDVRIENRGDGPMPASFGFHPAFAWPLPYGQPRDAHRILFDKDEPERLNEISNGLIAPATRPHRSMGRTLQLATICSPTMRWSGTGFIPPASPMAQHRDLSSTSPSPTRRSSASGPSRARIMSASSRGTASPTRRAIPATSGTSRASFEIAARGDWTCSLGVTLRP